MISTIEAAQQRKWRHSWENSHICLTVALTFLSITLPPCRASYKERSMLMDYFKSPLKSFGVAHPQLSGALRLADLVGDRQYGKLLAVGASDHCLGQIRQFDASAARLGAQGFKGMLGGETVTFHHQTSCDAHHAR